MARSIQQQLLDAVTERGLSYEQLLRDTGLDMTSDSLSRKLRGKQVLFTREAELISRTIGAPIHFVPRRRAA